MDTHRKERDMKNEKLQLRQLAVQASIEWEELRNLWIEGKIEDIPNKVDYIVDALFKAGYRLQNNGEWVVGGDCTDCDDWSPIQCEKCNHYGICSDYMIHSAEVCDCDYFEPDRMITARQLLAILKVRPLGNTNLYVIDRAEYDALKKKYGNS